MSVTDEMRAAAQAHRQRGRHSHAKELERFATELSGHARAPRSHIHTTPEINVNEQQQAVYNTAFRAGEAAALTRLGRAFDSGMGLGFCVGVGVGGVIAWLVFGGVW